MLYPLKPFQPDLSVNSSSFMRVEMSWGTLFLEGRGRRVVSIHWKIVWLMLEELTVGSRRAFEEGAAGPRKGSNLCTWYCQVLQYLSLKVLDCQSLASFVDNHLSPCHFMADVDGLLAGTGSSVFCPYLMFWSRIFWYAFTFKCEVLLVMLTASFWTQGNELSAWAQARSHYSPWPQTQVRADVNC
jgi:hypothetical protein